MKICGFVLNGSVKSLVVCCAAFLGNQLVQAGRMLKRVRMSALPLLAVSSVLGLVGTSQAAGYSGGIPWQVGDVIICFGSGTCNVVRIESGVPTLLDQFSDGLLGATRGVAINNTLHAVVTDNGSGGQSNIVVYSIASLNPTLEPAPILSHTPVNTFNPSPNNAQAVVVNADGHMFVGNAGSGGTAAPSIVELNPNGTLASPSALPSNPFTLPSSCTDTKGQVLSMDLNAAGISLYLTSGGGTIQQLTLASGICTPFANFGPNITLNDIKDIPPAALGNVASCKGVPCPADETLLVVAKGIIDPPGVNVDICTDLAVSGTPGSCALLLDTNPADPGLTSPLWKAGTQYFTVGGKILDPFLELQRVTTAGTSGTLKPPFSETGGTVIDNAVIWTDKGQPAWTLNTPYTFTVLPGTPYIVDTNHNLETVTVAGTSGPTQPIWPLSGNTIDGLVWTDQGAWLANHTFLLGSAVGDAAGHPHTVLTAGTSGSGALPAGGWNDSGGITVDNAVTWTNQGPVIPYTGNHAFALNTLIQPGGPGTHIQEAVEPGTSGGSTPNFSTSGGRTIDNAVTWTDQGQEFWHPSFSFPAGAVVVDPAGHLQLVTSAGTSGAAQPAFNDAGGTVTDGLQWTDQGPPGTWTMGTAYALSAVILDTAGHVQQVVSAGTSGGSLPSFNDTGSVTPDGTVVWIDRGIKSTWTATTAYALNAVILDTAGHVQQVVSAGTSGTMQPTFNDTGSTTPDNAVLWTDENVLTWQANFSYTAASPGTTYIVDPASHVQKVTTAGTSGPSQPTFNDGGMTTDNTVTWTDQGQRFWHPSFAFGTGAVIVDPAGHVQFVTAAGTSGPAQPKFVDGATPGGTVTDGLQWTDQGPPATSGWIANQAYSTNQFIVDATSNHVQQVVFGGTSGSSAPSFNTSGGYTLDGSVVWIDDGISTYQLNHLYNVGNAFYDGVDIQQATTAGTSGGAILLFANTPGTVTPDNAVVWTDEGVLTWQASFSYTATTASTTYIVDSANHVQKVTVAGTSGGSEPTFNDGGVVIDGLVWMDLGGVINWTASTSYSPSPVTLFVDPHSFLQEVTTAGISGTPSQPAWNETPLATTIDGLQWTDQGKSMWAANTHFFTLGTLISDPATHAQKVTEAGTSGATQPMFNDAGSTTIDNAVTWTESHPMWASDHVYTIGNPDTLILDTNNNVQLVTNNNVSSLTTSGTSGPAAPTWSMTTGSATIDGLQWMNQNTTPDTSVVARYPVTGINTIQALALDPLVANCTGNNCASIVPKPTINNFWLGDFGSANFYKLDFATGANGTPTPLNANANCSSHSGCNSSFASIQGLDIYGAEGANQADLTKLSATSLTSANNFTAEVTFPPLAAAPSINTWALTEYAYPTGPAPVTTPLTLYASLIAQASAVANGGNNSGATDVSSTLPSAPCEPTTTDPTKCIIWKADLLLPSGDYLAENLSSPTGIDNGTNVFVDLHYNVTTSVGNVDPPGKSSGSVHSLHEITTTFSASGPNPSGCFYVSPAPSLPSPGACFKSNRGTLPFIFQCTNLTPTQMANLSKAPGPPLLSMVETFPTQTPKPAPQTVFLTTSNGKAPFRYDSSSNEYVFNWSPNGAKGTFRACTFDPTNTVQTFCVDFTMKTSCP